MTEGDPTQFRRRVIRLNPERTSGSPEEVLVDMNCNAAGDMDIGHTLTPTRRSRRLKQRVNVAVDVPKRFDPSSEQLTPPDIKRRAGNAKLMLGEKESKESESDEDGKPRKRGRPDLLSKEKVKGFTDAQIKKFLSSLKKFPSPLTRIEKVAENCGLSDRSLADLQDLGQQLIRRCKAAVAEQKAKEVADGLQDGVTNRTTKPREKAPLFKVIGVSINAKTTCNAVEELEPLGEIIPVDEESRKTWKLDFKVKVSQFDVDWTLEDDTKLLLGIWEYGMGSWKEICESDPVLKDKILLDADSKPLLKHVHTRARYLLGVIKKHQTFQRLNQAETDESMTNTTAVSIAVAQSSQSQRNVDVTKTPENKHQESEGPLPVDVALPLNHIAPLLIQSSKPAGLKNIGNSCYMNAVMQALFSLPLFKTYVMTNKVAANGSQRDICTQMSKAFVEMNRGTEAVDLSILQNAFQIQKPSFQVHEQQDAQEFLLNLIDILDDDFKRLYNSFKMKEFFEGQVISKVTCETCQNESPRSEPFTIFSLPLPTIPSKSTVTLMECLEIYSTTERLTDYQCNQCKTSRPASLRRTLTKLPKYVIIHFQRSKSIQTGQQIQLSKLETDVNFPLNDLQIRLASNQDPVRLQLRAVCNHLGKTLKSGHYTAFTRSIDTSHWYMCNDSIVNLLDNGNPKAQICTPEAYIVIYEQLPSPTTDVPAAVQPITPSSVSQQIPTPLNSQRTTAPVQMEFPFKCDKCIRVFKTEKGLNTHSQRFCLGSNLSANGTPMKNELLTHLANFSKSNPYRCRLLTCLENFEDQKKLIIHMNEIHKLPRVSLQKVRTDVISNYKSKQINPLECDICFKVFNSKEALRNHQKAKHINQNPAQCSICFKICKNSFSLANHIKHVHQSKQYKCHQCKNVYSTKFRWEHHLYKVHGIFEANATPYKDESWLCDVCEQQFMTETTYKRHMLTHSATRWKCPSCPLDYISKNSLNRHIKEKHQLIPRKENDAGKAFRHLRGIQKSGRKTGVELNIPGRMQGRTWMSDQLIQSRRDYDTSRYAETMNVAREIQQQHNLNSSQKNVVHVLEPTTRRRAPILMKNGKQYVVFGISKRHVLKNSMQMHDRRRQINLNPHQRQQNAERVRKFYQRHCKQNQYQCSFCSAKFCFIANMKNHIRVYHSSDPLTISDSIKYNPFHIRRILRNLKLPNELNENSPIVSRRIRHLNLYADRLRRETHRRAYAAVIVNGNERVEENILVEYLQNNQNNPWFKAKYYVGVYSSKQKDGISLYHTDVQTGGWKKSQIGKRLMAGDQAFHIRSWHYPTEKNLKCDIGEEYQNTKAARCMESRLQLYGLLRKRYKHNGMQLEIANQAFEYRPYLQWMSDEDKRATVTVAQREDTPLLCPNPNCSLTEEEHKIAANVPFSGNIHLKQKDIHEIKLRFDEAKIETDVMVNGVSTKKHAWKCFYCKKLFKSQPTFQNHCNRCQLMKPKLKTSNESPNTIRSFFNVKLKQSLKKSDEDFNTSSNDVNKIVSQLTEICERVYNEDSAGHAYVLVGMKNMAKLTSKTLKKIIQAHRDDENFELVWYIGINKRNAGPADYHTNQFCSKHMNSSVAKWLHAGNRMFVVKVYTFEGATRNALHEIFETSVQLYGFERRMYYPQPGMRYRMLNRRLQTAPYVKWMTDLQKRQAIRLGGLLTAPLLCPNPDCKDESIHVIDDYIFSANIHFSSDDVKELHLSDGSSH